MQQKIEDRIREMNRWEENIEYNIIRLIVTAHNQLVYFRHVRTV